MYPDQYEEMDDNKKNQEPEQVESEQETEDPVGEAVENGSDVPLSPEYVTPGQYLLTAREKSGLNRARVGQALGLTETAVKNLEINGFDLFPGSVYVRGYLKNYARLLGSSEDELIALYDRYCAEHQLDNGRTTADLSAMPASQGSNRTIITAAVTILVIIVLAFIAVSSFT